MSIRFRALHLLPVALAAAALLPIAAEASYASQDYQGAYASSSPTGYQAAAAVTPPGTSVEYDFTVSNNGSMLLPPPPQADVRVQRITEARGVYLGDGRAAMSEDDVLAATANGGSADPPQTIATLSGSTLLFGQSLQVTTQFTPSRCGYWVIWAGDADNRSSSDTVLNAGVVRVAGCASGASPSPTPTHHRSTTASGTGQATSALPTTGATRATPQPSASARPRSGGRRTASAEPAFDAAAFPPAGPPPSNSGYYDPPNPAGLASASMVGAGGIVGFGLLGALGYSLVRRRSRA
jgi:hypothetical protein